MATELEIAFYLHNVLQGFAILFNQFKYLDLEFKLFVEILTLLEYLKRISFPFIEWLFIISDLKYFTKSSRTKYLKNLKPICNMIPNNSFIIILIIPKILFKLSQKGFMSNIKDILIIFNFFLLIFSQIGLIERVLSNNILWVFIY